MYEVVYAQHARKALKRLRKSGSFTEGTFKELLTSLICNKTLPAHFKDHQLHGSLAQFRECHLEFNLLVLYERDEVLQIITISKIGTHVELFGE